MMTNGFLLLIVMNQHMAGIMSSESSYKTSTNDGTHLHTRAIDAFPQAKRACINDLRKRASYKINSNYSYGFDSALNAGCNVQTRASGSTQAPESTITPEQWIQQVKLFSMRQLSYEIFLRGLTSNSANPLVHDDQTTEQHLLSISNENYKTNQNETAINQQFEPVTLESNTKTKGFGNMQNVSKPDYIDQTTVIAYGASSNVNGVSIRKNNSIQIPKCINNDELSLAFLSFGLYYAANDSETMRNDANARCSGNNVPVENSENYIYNCEINVKDAQVKMFISQLEKLKLFGEIEPVIRFQKTMYVNVKKTIEPLKQYESIYNFVDNLNLADYNIDQVKKFYQLFVCAKFLDYNPTIHCYVLKTSVWGIQAFQSEIYFYIMSKLEMITFEDKIATDMEKEYKQHLIDEIKYMCKILDLYQEIVEISKDSLRCKTLIGIMYYRVEKFRKQIVSYLELFHAKAGATTFCYLANRMRNVPVRCNDKHLTKVKTAVKSNQPSFTTRQRISRRSVKTNDKKILKKHYQDLHLTKMSKNMIFVLAFTVDFSTIPASQYDLKTIQNLRKKKGRCFTPIRQFYRVIMANTIPYEPFENAVIYIVNFFSYVNNDILNIKGYSIRRKFHAMDLSDAGKSQMEKTSSRDAALHQILISYHTRIMKSMGFYGICLDDDH